ncbi:glycine oxidase ThiO [Phormidium sp. LEGE 05292]|uniref:glycine oxidase ThiO n=1 Tax=[Phormidium] sp. LEGE 05292 TaxID=767427 RepID=UPI00187EA67F|nr:glycine oxidase ThiO [Phormidium sp. LEGE 05292]MBE9229823.1 glycine oxidase ThiO [Phormidium sp. LEGE 05292]
MNKVSDVLIIGGGIIGLSLAIELKLRRVKVTVLSRNFQEAATHAAAGMLAPQAEKIPPSPMLDLCLQSRAIYPDWIRKLEEITGLETGYWPCGILAPVYDAGEQESRGAGENLIANQVWLNQLEIQQHLPGISSEVVGGWWYPDDGQVDNRALAHVLLMAAQQLGIEIVEGVAVTEFVRENQQIKYVKSLVGDWQAERYVLATGAWSQELLPIAVYPKKGQMLSVRSRSVHLAESLSSTQELNHVLFGDETYIVPRKDGRIVIGATSENVGFTPDNTAAGIQQLLSGATRLYPPLKNLPILEFWWGFRPATPDELPILGTSAYENLTLATGHYRNGILLAPITALLIADLLEKQIANSLLSHFHYTRFTEK